MHDVCLSEENKTGARQCTERFLAPFELAYGNGLPSSLRQEMTHMSVASLHWNVKPLLGSGDS